MGKGARLFLFLKRVPEKVRGVCCCICSACCWCCNFDAECTPIGRTHNILSEFEPSGLLPFPFGCWSTYLHVEGQCGNQDCCGMCDSGLEFVGCVSFYELSCGPKEKSFGTLSSLPHVCICWVPHHCY